MHDTPPTVTGIPFIVSAPSGAGKTSLLRRLLEQLDHVRMSVSHTTRAPRPGEQDGIHYHFVSQAQFEALIAADDLLEYAKVFDHYYGTSRSALQQHLQAGHDVILEIDWQGARLVRERLPETCSIFILPPSRTELERRLRERAQDSEAVIQRRLRDAATDCAHYHEYDYTVFNLDFATALHDLECIFRSQRLLTAQQAQRQSGRIHGILEM